MKLFVMLTNIVLVLCEMFSSQDVFQNNSCILDMLNVNELKNLSRCLLADKIEVRCT